MATFNHFETDISSHKLHNTPVGTFVLAEVTKDVWLRTTSRWICLADGYESQDEKTNPSAFIRGRIIKQFTVRV